MQALYRGLRLWNLNPIVKGFPLREFSVKWKPSKGFYKGDLIAQPDVHLAFPFIRGWFGSQGSLGRYVRVAVPQINTKK
jgi:hypothetical protein